MSDVNSQRIHECISNFRGLDDARTLYCTLLNYDPTEDLPIPTDAWSRSAREIFAEGTIIARKGNFNILYVTIRRLTRTNERTVLKEILNKGFPDCAVIFSDETGNEFHLTSPKYEPELRYKFVIRRYVVGKYEKLRTASERLCLTYALDSDTTTELKAKHDKAFNVEAVTKEFYEEYKSKLTLMEEKLLAQGIGNKKTAKGFAQQFLNRLMFLYFIQKKGWLNNDGNFVLNLVKSYKKTGGTPNGLYKDWLGPLFFYSFNHKEIPDSYSNLPADLHDIFKRMPYLNGGLFVRNDYDDCGYQLEDSSVFKVVDDLLERFNFTISEDTPFDVDVAVDPEMLGKVYESLILEEERGEAGIFYTPRIEVDFMCRQSLLEYLIENTGIAQGKLISFLYAIEEDRADLLSEEEAQNIGNSLFRAQIVDPACGSGAFLVGMLHVLMDLYALILKRLNKRLNLFEIKKEIISNNLYGVDIKDWAVRVAELRLWLTLLVQTEESEIHVDATKPLLPNLTLKLRCGDSLVQEIAGKPLSARALMTHLDPVCKTRVKELYDEKKNYYYSRADDPEVLFKIKRKEIEIIRMLVDSEIKRIDFMLRPLAATQQQLGSAQTAIIASETKRTEDKLKLEQEKERLRELLRSLESVDVKKKFFWEIDFAEVFADGGFDIVIANPPYVRQEKIAPLDRPEEEITTEVKKEYKGALVRSVDAQWGNEFKKNLKSDVYIYFYYHGLSLLKPGGVFCFISSNSWLDVGFGANLQEFLLRNIEVKAIYDNHAKRSFEEASINTIIALFKRPADSTNLWENLTKLVAFKKPFEEVITTTNLLTLAAANEKLTTADFRCIPMTQGKLWREGLEVEETQQTDITGSEFIGNYEGNTWGGKYIRAPDIFFKIMEKGKGKFNILREVANLRRGLTTNIDKFFYVKEEDIEENRLEKEYWMHKGENGKMMPNIFMASPKEGKFILIDAALLGYRVLMIHKPRSELQGTRILKYIEHGENLGYHKKRGSRENWYDLGMRTPAPILLPGTFNDRFIAFLNKPKVIEDQGFYGITPHDEDHTIILCAYLNSTLAVMFYELNSWRSLGEGALRPGADMLKRIPVINPNIKYPIDKLEGIMRSLCGREIGSLFDELGVLSWNDEVIIEKIKSDRRSLDKFIMEDILGLTEEEQKDFYRAVCELVRQRLEKARSV